VTMEQRTMLAGSCGYETRRDGLGNVFVRRVRLDGQRQTCAWELLPDGSYDDVLTWLRND
jgi:hypothetical protein